MTPKQVRFCEEYLIDLNATQAAIRAGYSEKTARQIGEENLSKPDIKIYIDELLEKISSEKIATATEVMEILTSMARGEIKEECVIVENIGDFMSEAKIMEKTVTPKDRIKAAELIGKRYKLFTDNINHEGGSGVVILNDVPRSEED